jgi:hypothetical protein
VENTALVERIFFGLVMCMRGEPAMILPVRLFQESPAHWRDLAEQAHEAAASMKTSAARRELLLIAKRYERLALCAEQLEALTAGPPAALPRL